MHISSPPRWRLFAGLLHLHQLSLIELTVCANQKQAFLHKNCDIRTGSQGPQIPRSSRIPGKLSLYLKESPNDQFSGSWFVKFFLEVLKESFLTGNPLCERKWNVLHCTFLRKCPITISDKYSRTSKFLVTITATTSLQQFSCFLTLTSDEHKMYWSLDGEVTLNPDPYNFLYKPWQKFKEQMLALFSSNKFLFVDCYWETITVNSWWTILSSEDPIATKLLHPNDFQRLTAQDMSSSNNCKCR